MITDYKLVRHYVIDAAIAKAKVDPTWNPAQPTLPMVKLSQAHFDQLAEELHQVEKSDHVKSARIGFKEYPVLMVPLIRSPVHLPSFIPVIAADEDKEAPDV